MTGRFAAPELLNLGRPPKLAAKDYELLRSETIADMVARFEASGTSFDVDTLEFDPGIIVAETGAYRDLLRRQQIDDAVAQTYLGSASGAMLDQRAADYGVLRRIVQFADPVLNLPEIVEDDESVRLRARLAWEAQSVAGPAGAYVFHVLDAHEGVFDALAIGPETGIVSAGEVLVVVQSRTNNGIPTDNMLDVIADRLDAYVVVYSSGSSEIRTVRNQQSVRPLGARVTVVGAQPLVYNTTATLYVSSYGDAETLRLAAVAQLEAYQERSRRIWQRVSKEGRQAALSLVGADGLPVIDEVEVAEDDVIPSHLEIPVPGVNTLTVVVR